MENKRQEEMFRRAMQNKNRGIFALFGSESHGYDPGSKTLAGQLDSGQLDARRDIFWRPLHSCLFIYCPIKHESTLGYTLLSILLLEG